MDSSFKLSLPRAVAGADVSRTKYGDGASARLIVNLGKLYALEMLAALRLSPDIKQ